MSEKIIAAAAIILALSATWFALKPDSEPAPAAGGRLVVIGHAAAPAAPDDNKGRSHEIYTEGLRYFQAADYARAQEKWNEALMLDPENPDAAAGLDRIKKITGK